MDSYSCLKKMRAIPKGIRGTFLLELMCGLAIAGVIFAAVTNFTQDVAQQARAAGMANWFREYERAAQMYINVYSNELYNHLPDTNSHLIVTAAEGAKKGGTPIFTGSHNGKHGLSAFMTGKPGLSPFEQDVALYVYRNKDGAGVHGLLMTTGGRPAYSGAGAVNELNNYMLVANQASMLVNGGIVGARSNNGLMQGTRDVHGSRGTWSFTLGDANTGNLPASNPGQLAKGVYASTSTVQDDSLYRIEVPGHEELNAMNTDLHMNGWTINNSGTISISNDPQITGSSGTKAAVDGLGNGLVIDPIRIAATQTDSISRTPQSICDGGGGSGPKPDGFLFTLNNAVNPAADPRDISGLYMCMGGHARMITDTANASALKDITLVTNGTLVKKPVCPKGAKPQIFVTPVMMAKGYEAPPIVAVQAAAADEGANWRVRIRLKTTDEDEPEDFVEELPNTVGSSTNFTSALAFSSCTRESGTSVADDTRPNNIRTGYTENSYNWE